ncbi:WD40-repeat-containing domain protein [Aspergillus venezuelensis]
MAGLLTDRQAGELHKAMIAYLKANNLTETAAIFRKEANLEEDIFDKDTTKKYEGMLEKKWTGTMRLQRRQITDLESENKRLKSELENTAPLSRRIQDPESWLPSSPQHTLQSHRDKINCLAFHPIYTILASGSDDCAIQIWDYETCDLERTLKAHTKVVRDLDFGGSENETLLASCSHEHIISAVRFVPGSTGGNGNILISASRDTDIRIWNVSTGYYLRTRVFTGHGNFIECCAFAPSASYEFLAPLAGLPLQPKRPSSSSDKIPETFFLATGARDNTIKIWDSRGTCLLTVVGHDSWVQATTIHPAGRYILSVSDDKKMKSWDLSQGERCVRSIDAHERFVTCLKADGREKKREDIRCVVATGAWDCKVKAFAG